jgi:adenosine deaminase
MEILDFIKNLPKTELHLHIEGSLSPELMFKLAGKNNIQLPFKSVAEVQNAYQFHNLQSFLDIYYQGAQVLIHEEDFYELTWEYLLKCKEDGVVHTEIFFDPQTHTDRGISFDTVMNGIQKALKDGKEKLGISSFIIMCFLRHLSEDEAFKTLKLAEPYTDQIIGVGLDSSEMGHPPEKFQRVFEKAMEMGLKTVAHAGEEGPAEYIWQALDLLKIERIDHGVRCIEDEKLVQFLIEKQIPLTVCPLSNIKLKVFQDMKDHNIKQLLDKGLLVTINSDDPTYFGGFMADNYLACFNSLSLTKEDLTKFAKNSFKASFLDSENKQYWLNKF